MYQVVGKVMTKSLSTKEIHRVTLGIPKGTKNATSVYIIPGPETLIRIENIASWVSNLE